MSSESSFYSSIICLVPLGFVIILHELRLGLQMDASKFLTALFFMILNFLKIGFKISLAISVAISTIEENINSYFLNPILQKKRRFQVNFGITENFSPCCRSVL